MPIICNEHGKGSVDAFAQNFWELIRCAIKETVLKIVFGVQNSLCTDESSRICGAIDELKFY